MQQKPLFDGTDLLVETPIARRTDHTSSHDAAEHAQESGLVGRHERLILEAAKANPGKTSKELAGLSGLDRVAAARRMKGLVGKGLLREVREPGKQLTYYATGDANV